MMADMWEDDDDDLSVAYGVVVAFVAGTVFWAVVGLLLWWVL